MSRPASTPRTFWQHLRRVLLILLLLALSPFLLWWVINRIDESPSPEAQRFAAPPSRTVADVDNAWLYLAGLGAPENEDPRVHGRRRVDAIAARYAQSPVPPADANEQALFVDAIAAVGPDPKQDATGSLCPQRSVDCIDWALRHAAMLDRLRAANTLRLTRFETMLDMPDWQALYVPAMDAPVPDFSIAALHLNLLALDLARMPPGTQPSGVLARIARIVTFWRGVQTHPQDGISLLVAARRIEDTQRLTGALLERHGGGFDDADEALLDDILRAPDKPIDWSGAMAYEYQVLARAFADGVPGQFAALRQCISGTAETGCLKTIGMSAAFAPQATLNLHAGHRTQMLRMLNANPRDYARVQKEAGLAMEATFVNFEDTQVILRQLGYNYSGRVLAQIAIPAFDWGLRVHDQDAVRRMLVLKREATRRKLANEAMPAFLAEQPDALRNPHDGEPFAWDPLFQEIHFAPRADKYWKRPSLAIHYSAEAYAGIDDCDEPVRWAFNEVINEKAEDTVELHSCATGNTPYWPGMARISRDEEDLANTLKLHTRYYDAEVRRHGQQVGVRVLINDGEHLQRYEGKLDIGGESDDLILDPVGHDSETSLYARLSFTDIDRLLTVNAQNQHPRELAEQLAARNNLRLQGLTHLRSQPITLHHDMPPNQLLQTLARHSNLNLTQPAASTFEFTPKN